MSEMQMFEVFAVASQRESVYREENRTAQLWRSEGPLGPWNLGSRLSVQIKGPHTTVLIARRQVREALLIKMNEFLPKYFSLLPGFLLSSVKLARLRAWFECGVQ